MNVTAKEGNADSSAQGISLKFLNEPIVLCLAKINEPEVTVKCKRGLVVRENNKLIKRAREESNKDQIVQQFRVTIKFVHETFNSQPP